LISVFSAAVSYVVVKIVIFGAVSYVVSYISQFRVPFLNLVFNTGSALSGCFFGRFLYQASLVL
jgi:hypothetical protein